MRMILFFDLPVTTPQGRREYTRFVKYLDSDGFIRIQESVFCKLCINIDSAKTLSDDGDIRFIIVSEKQYQSITNVNDTYSLQESITTDDRCITIGGMNDDN